jgi:DNA polymerase-3 subunit alpha
VLTNGKGFYHPLVYVLEARRLGLAILPPSVNKPGPGFGVEQKNGKKAIRVPATRIKGLTTETKAAMVQEAARQSFSSMCDFFSRVGPRLSELELLIKCGAFDGFGQKRTAQFWEAQALAQIGLRGSEANQGWLIPPVENSAINNLSLREPTRMEQLQAENELLDFPVSGHPLDLYPDIAWETYCPVKDLGKYCGKTVVACGLIVEGRVFHQVTGEPMKFLTLADWTGIIETELFAKTYKSYGLATVRYPVLEITAAVEPFENGRGWTLRALRAGKPRTR